MSALGDIGINVLSPGGDANARAVLREIETLLQGLKAGGEGGSIDLGSLPLTPEDYDLLEASLGKGEVSAEVESLGPTEVTETGISGVWWITHYNADEEVMAEFIAVTLCPEILLTTLEDVSDGLQRLHALLDRTTLCKEGGDAG